MRRSALALVPLILATGCSGPQLPEIPARPPAGVRKAPAMDSAQHVLSAMVLRLLGEWHDVQPDGRTVFHEQWERTDDAFHTGLGFVLSGNDTVFIEHLNIHWDATGAWYSARIPSQNGGVYVDFALAHASPDSLVFTNPAHDFPQRIRYAPEADGWNVLVSGTENGAARSETFHLTRRPPESTDAR